MCQRRVLLARIKGKVRQVQVCKWTTTIEGSLEPLCRLTHFFPWVHLRVCVCVYSLSLARVRDTYMQGCDEQNARLLCVEIIPYRHLLKERRHTRWLSTQCASAFPTPCCNLVLNTPDWKYAIAHPQATPRSWRAYAPCSEPSFFPVGVGVLASPLQQRRRTRRAGAVHNCERGCAGCSLCAGQPDQSVTR